MGDRLEVIPATPAHAKVLAERLRIADEVELRASGTTPIAALELGLEASEEPKTVLVDGHVAAMFGVIPIPDSDGGASAWLLTSPLVDRVPFAFLRLSKLELGRMLERYCPVFNYIDTRHAKALRWASWLGCEVREPVPHGPENQPFNPVLARRPACARHS